jgi:hypothetical protein
MEELEEAVGLETSDTYLHTDRTAKNAGDRLVSACGNLVVYNTIDDTVTFAHHTIQQFLLSPQSFNAHGIHQMVHLDPTTSSRELGEICIAYLCFSDFETQLVNAPKPVTIERQEVEQMVWAGVPLAPPIRGILSWRLPWTKASPDKAYPHMTLNLPSAANPSEALVRKYILLEYVIESWPFHAASFDEHTQCWASFKDVVLHRQLMFNFRPWLEEQHQLKVNATLERLKVPRSGIFGRRTSTFSSKAQQALSIYTWAMGHNIKSLLALSDQLGLSNYLQEAYDYSHMPRGYADDLFKMITKTGSARLPELWSGQSIVFILDAYPKLSTETLNAGQILKVLEAELRAWASPICPSPEQLFEDAIVESVRLSSGEIFSKLIDFYVNTGEQLARTFIAICKAGYLHKQLILRLLQHPVHGIISDETVLELAFAFEICPSDFFMSDSFALLELPLDLSWSLIISSMIVVEDVVLVSRLLTSRHETWELSKVNLLFTKTFNMHGTEGATAKLGSINVYNRLKAFDGMDVLEIAFTQAKACKDPGPDSELSLDSRRKSSWLALLESLFVRLDTFQFYRKLGTYEARGIHMLNWASEWRLTMPDQFKEKYRLFVLIPENEDLAMRILQNGANGSVHHWYAIKKMLWTVHVLQKVQSLENIPDLRRSEIEKMERSKTERMAGIPSRETFL